MRKAIISILILCSFSCQTQLTIPMSMNNNTKFLKNDNYIKDTENKLNQFAGVWKWTSGNSSFELDLTKVERWNVGNIRDFYSDVIMGGYKYVDNSGVTITDKLNYHTVTSTDPAQMVNHAVVTGNIVYPNTTRLNILLMDVAKAKQCIATLTLQAGPNGTMQAQWNLFDKERIHLHGEPDPAVGFSIPTTLLLTKQP